ncbi:MAG TPA: PspC domain-containing protein [Anditalea sp.]|nr:PspC domain-containing protein [Anditalea sp.]
MNKKLTRSSRNKMIAGVCGGLANYFGISADKMRLIYVLISIFSAAFPGLFVYIILWIILPEDPLIG